MHEILGFKKENIKDYTPSKSLESLIALVSETMTEEEYQNSPYGSQKFYGEVNVEDWANNNKEANPRNWLSIYKFDKFYGSNWKSQPKACPQEWKGNVLDFGAGPGTPWTDIREEFILYLLEANLVIADMLRESYKDYDNVKVVTSLLEVKDIQFNFIYSKEVIEHVRYTNEHFDIFYLLTKPEGECKLLIDPSPAPGHVYNLHEDSISNQFWSQYIN